MASERYIGFGASYYICKDEAQFVGSLDELSPIDIHIEDGRLISAKHHGKVSVVFTTCFGTLDTVLGNVLYIPQSNVNFLSVVQVQNKGYFALLERDSFSIYYIYQQCM